MSHETATDPRVIWCQRLILVSYKTATDPRVFWCQRLILVSHETATDPRVVRDLSVAETPKSTVVSGHGSLLTLVDTSTLDKNPATWAVFSLSSTLAAGRAGHICHICGDDSVGSRVVTSQIV